MRQRLRGLLRLDVLALVMAMTALASTVYNNHRTQERLNEMEQIRIPHMPHPLPVGLEEGR